MTVSGTSNRQAAQACDGVTILFELTLEYNVEEEITATLRHKTTNAETELTLNSDFEIPVSPDPDAGNVRLIGDYATSPPSSSYELHIIRILPLTQSSTFNGLNSISAGTTIEARVDKMTMMVQQLQDQLNRAAIAATTSGLSGIVLPMTASKYLKVNSGGDDLEGVDGEPPTNLWRYGSGAPSDSLGNNGDYYLDTDTGDIYYKSAGTWGAAIANIKGDQGEAGDMTNPMTTLGDIIVGGASGVPSRKAIGTALQHLRVNATGNGHEYVSVILDKLDATAAPTVGDDSADGYSVGSKWCDVTNDKAYICIDATEGAAVWIFIGPAYQTHRYVWYFPGDCEVGANKVIHRLGVQGETVVDVFMSVATGDEPTGCSLIGDIKEDGVSIFSTKPEIDASGTEEDGNHVVSDSSLAADARLTAEITQKGSTLPGTDMTMILLTKEAVL